MGAVWEGGEGENSREEMIAMKVMEDGGGGLTAVMVLQSPGGQGQRGEEAGAVGPRATPLCVVWRGDGVKTASGGDEGEGEGLLNGTARGRVGEVSGLKWEQGWTRTQEADYYMFNKGIFMLQMNLL